MNRDEFLGDTEVAHVKNELADLLANRPLHHRYYHFDTRHNWSCDSAFHAASTYCFPIGDRHIHNLWASLHPDTPLVGNLFQTTAILNELRRRLLDAVDNGSESRAFQACDLVLRWGGVLKGNSDLLVSLRDDFDGGLVAYLTAARALLTADQDYSATEAQLADNQVLYCTAGFTKIYALLVDDFVIYDSRVAAALGMLIARLCAAAGWEIVPAQLRFLWMPARSRRNRQQQYVPGQLRNPGVRRLRFSTQRNHAHYLTHNVRAGWLLREAVEGTRVRDWPGRLISEDARCAMNSICCAVPRPPVLSAMRAVEAALFMIGYDLSGNPGYPANPFAPPAANALE